MPKKQRAKDTMEGPETWNILKMVLNNNPAFRAGYKDVAEFRKAMTDAGIKSFGDKFVYAAIDEGVSVGDLFHRNGQYRYVTQVRSPMRRQVIEEPSSNEGSEDEDAEDAADETDEQGSPSDETVSGTATASSSRRKMEWTTDESEALEGGVEKYGVGNWRAIKNDSEFGPLLLNRTNVMLKDKWRTLSRAAVKAIDIDEDFPESGDNSLLEAIAIAIAELKEPGGSSWPDIVKEVRNSGYTPARQLEQRVKKELASGRDKGLFVRFGLTHWRVSDFLCQYFELTAVPRKRGPQSLEAKNFCKIASTRGGRQPKDGSQRGPGPGAGTGKEKANTTAKKRPHLGKTPVAKKTRSKVSIPTPAGLPVRHRSSGDCRQPSADEYDEDDEAFEFHNDMTWNDFQSANRGKATAAELGAFWHAQTKKGKSAVNKKTTPTHEPKSAARPRAQARNSLGAGFAYNDHMDWNEFQRENKGKGGNADLGDYWKEQKRQQKMEQQQKASSKANSEEQTVNYEEGMNWNRFQKENKGLGQKTMAVAWFHANKRTKHSGFKFKSPQHGEVATSKRKHNASSSESADGSTEVQKENNRNVKQRRHRTESDTLRSLSRNMRPARASRSRIQPKRFDPAGKANQLSGSIASSTAVIRHKGARYAKD